MGQSTRNTLKLKVRQPNLKSLIDLSNKLPSGRRESFPNLYGNIVDLLTVKVQAEALTALAQFYDMDLRCFTFQDYQLAPTLEEFEQILRFPAEKNEPYQYVETYSIAKALADILKVAESKLAKEVLIKDGMEGLTREYLEKTAGILAGKHDWSAFTDVLALLIYGIVLFPHTDNFIDYTAIDVFLAFKTRQQSPTSVILADVYYALHERHYKKGGVILCCLPVWYRWLTSHIFKKHIEDKSKSEWSQYLAGLKGSDISWCSLARDVKEFIYQCDGFPNVPLIGTKGCITYNPVLAQRQFGYPTMHPPPAESLTHFVLHNRGSEDLDLLRRISRAWGRTIKKGRCELGRRGTNVGEGYLQWVQLRVQKIKLPFHYLPLAEPEIPEPLPVLNEEVEEAKIALTLSEEEKTRLQDLLEKTLQENAILRRENIIKGKRIAECEGRLEEGNAKCLRVQNALRGANEELQVRDRDRDRLIDKAYAWEAQFNRSLAAGKDLRVQLEEMKSQLERLTAEYEGKLATEKKARNVVRGRLEECHAMLQEELRNATELKEFAEYQKNLHAILEMEHEDLKKEYLKLDDRCRYFQDRFSMLAKFANDATVSVPNHLKDADIVMTRENTPAEVVEFVEHMKELIVVLKIKAKWPGVLKRKKAWMA